VVEKFKRLVSRL